MAQVGDSNGRSRPPAIQTSNEALSGIVGTSSSSSVEGAAPHGEEPLLSDASSHVAIAVSQPDHDVNEDMQSTPLPVPQSGHSGRSGVVSRSHSLANTSTLVVPLSFGLDNLTPKKSGPLTDDGNSDTDRLPPIDDALTLRSQYSLVSEEEKQFIPNQLGDPSFERSHTQPVKKKSIDPTQPIGNPALRASASASAALSSSSPSAASATTSHFDRAFDEEVAVHEPHHTPAQEEQPKLSQPAPPPPTSETDGTRVQFHYQLEAPFLSITPASAPSSNAADASSLHSDEFGVSQSQPKPRAQPLNIAAEMFHTRVEEVFIANSPPPVVTPDPVADSGIVRITVSGGDEMKINKDNKTKGKKSTPNVHSWDTNKQITAGNSTSARYPNGHRPQKPLSTPKIWHAVPKEIVSLLTEYMDPQTLARFSSTDKLNSKVGSRQALWEKISNEAVTYQPNFIPVPYFERKSDPRRYFGARWVAETKRFHKESGEHSEVCNKVKQNNRGYTLHVVTDWLFAPLTSILLTLQLILAVWQFSTTGGVSMLSMWPTIILVAYITFVMSIYCYSHFLSSRLSEGNSFMPPQFYEQTNTPLKDLMQSVYEGGCDAAQAWLCLAFFGLAAFIIVVTLRTARALTCDWGFIFLPLYVAFFLTIGLTVYTYRRASWKGAYYVDNLKWLWVGWSTIGIPLLAFFILLHLKLQYYPNTSTPELVIPDPVATPPNVFQLLGVNASRTIIEFDGPVAHVIDTTTNITLVDISTDWLASMFYFANGTSSISGAALSANATNIYKDHESFGTLPTSAVMAPLFLLEFFTFCYAIQRGYDRDYDSWDCGDTGMWLLFWFLLFGPPAAFQILLIMQYDVFQHMHIGLVFLPLYVLMLACIVIACLITCQVYNDAAWDEWEEPPARKHEVKHLPPVFRGFYHDDFHMDE